MADHHDKVCGLCGAGVRMTVVDGEKAEKCVCRVSYDDESMPACWYFEHESIKPPQ